MATNPFSASNHQGTQLNVILTSAVVVVEISSTCRRVMHREHNEGQRQSPDSNPTGSFYFSSAGPARLRVVGATR